jgi:uncharacterized protein (DUF58 family)
MFNLGARQELVFQDPQSRDLVLDITQAQVARARLRGERIRGEIDRASQQFYQTWLLLGLLLFLIGGIARLGVVLALSALVFGTGFVSRAWSHFSLQRLRYDRTFSRRRAFWGETIDVALRLANFKPIPLPWVRFEDEVPEALWKLADLNETANSPGRGLVIRTTSVSWYERVCYRFQLECRERGYHRFGPVRLRSADLFGLFPNRAELAATEYVLVYPRLVQFADLRLPGARPYGPLKGSLKLFEDPVRFRGLRDYQPTDPLKRIDWKASARRQDLQVRTYEPTANEHWLIVCNLQTIPSPHQGYIPYLLERAISTAASVAMEGNERQSAVGLIANSSLFNSDLPVRIRPNRDPEQIHRILEALAMASYISPFSINGVLRQESHRLPFATSIVVVTALMDESLLANVLHLKSDGHPVAILYVGDDPVEPDHRGLAVQSLGQELAEAGFVP